jgi:hypothetical protein
MISFEIHKDIYEEELRNNMKNLIQDCQSSGRDLTLLPPEHEAGGQSDFRRRLVAVTYRTQVN